MKKTILILTSLILAFGLSASNEALMTACKQGDLAAVKSAFDGGADVNAPDANGNPAIASAFLWPDITALLIEKGADVNGGNYPALVSAANNYSVEVMKMLIESGADPNKPGKLDAGATLRKMLADEKAKGKKANKVMVDAWEAALKNMQVSTVTAVQQTVQQTNCVPCLKLLLDNGAGIESNGDGNILHTLAAFSMTQQGRKEAFAAGKAGMESYGLKVPDWYIDLPAEKNGQPSEMLNLLVGKGADVNQLNSHQLNPLLTAMGTKKVELAKAMIKAGADVKYYPKENARDAVNMAAELGDMELLKMIVEKGGDVTRETWDRDAETGGFCKGFTALTRAAIHDNLECARYLIEAGCKVREGISGYFVREARTRGGKGKLLTTLTGKQLYCRYKLTKKMAIYFAIENNNMEMVKLLAESFGWYQNHSMEMKPQHGNETTGRLFG